MGLADVNGGATLPRRGHRRIFPLLLLPFRLLFHLAGVLVGFALSLISIGLIAHTIVWLLAIGWGLIG